MGNWTGWAMLDIATELFNATHASVPARDRMDMVVDRVRATDRFADDVEFEDGLYNPESPFTRLIFEALAPNGLADLPVYMADEDDEDYDEDRQSALHDATFGALHALYGFC